MAEILCQHGLRNTHKEFGRHNRENLWYPLYGRQDGSVSVLPEVGAVEIYPVWPNGFEGCWTWDSDLAEHQSELLIWRRVGDRDVVYRKGYSRTENGNLIRQKLKTIWKDAKYHTEKGNSEIASLKLKFDNPKPLVLLQEILSSFPQDDLLILDSFAGSATTGHAVLTLNAESDLNYRFILVEQQEYADSVTGARIRNVIEGIPGSEDARFRDALGGSFTYCTLGDAIDMDGLLTGQDLPSVESLAALLYHTATAKAFDAAALTPASDIGEAVMRLGEANGRHLWLFYKPDLEWLKSADAALTLSRARAIADSAAGDHLVFAPAKFVSRELLTQERLPVEYAPLPFALYRVETA